MSEKHSILYYSNHCRYCQEVIYNVSRTNWKDEIHFICLDNRVKKNGSFYAILENGQEIEIPKNICRVPSLMLLNRGGMVMEGMQVKEYFVHKQNTDSQTKEDLGTFSMGDFGTVVSDTFSFLDQSSDELLSKGSGGTRQMHNYASINHMSHIETPPEDYVPDKIGQNTTIENIQSERDQLPSYR